nr:hypothetical protein [Pseudomonadota bacterium]
HGNKALIVLPPEDASEEKYFPIAPPYSHTRKSAIAFNALWREHAKQCENISFLDLSSVILPSDMCDVSHYTAGFLKKLAGYIDDWYGPHANSEPLEASIGNSQNRSEI